MPRLDTHATIQQLQAQGFSSTQAEGLTALIVQALDVTGQTVATKTDLEATRTALKTDLETQGMTLRSEIRELRILMESRFQTIDARFLFTHWMIGIAFTVLLGFNLGNLWLLLNLLTRLPKP